MKLEEIGFYTLENYRAENANHESDLWRCELLLTSKCNFSCPYCRGIDSSADLTFIQAKSIVNEWSKYNLRNIRFSGGEPTLVPWLTDLVAHTKLKRVNRIAISTNGSADSKVYSSLLEAGVNDFSFSLDACCSSMCDMMSGKKNYFSTIIENIKYLSSKTYVTVGVVLTKNNIGDIVDIIKFASSLGVSDIRIITAAQWDVPINLELSSFYLDKHPILKYRWNNLKHGRNVRGIKETNSHKCKLLLDDMAVKGEYHYPCIIKMREGGLPIGKVNDNIREDRLNYYTSLNSYEDDICRKNCLDVCVDYNDFCLKNDLKNC